MTGRAVPWLAALLALALAACRAPPARAPAAPRALTPGERSLLRQRAEEERERWAREHAEQETETFDPGELAEHTRRLTQDQIESGSVKLAAVFQQGESFFDREVGPREGLGTGFAVRPRPGLARIERPPGAHGGDALSCRECHHRGGDDGHGEAHQRAWLFGDGHRTASAVPRVPPHLGGLGVVQLLAAEMTRELQRLRDSLVLAARVQHERRRFELSAQGLSFGFLGVAPDGTLDTRELRGIDGDLVVRPFGWRGSHATLRSFVTQAVEQHLGLDAAPIRGAERFAASLASAETVPSPTAGADTAAVTTVAPAAADPPPALAAEEYRLSRLDEDRDGIPDEVTAGQITSVAVYLALLDVPVVLPPDDPELYDVWNVGFAAFERVGCTGCHRAGLRLGTRAWQERAPGHRRALAFDVVRDVQVHPGLDDSAYDQGGAVVRLFSDLRRHDMGPALAERPEGSIGAREFLTRPLWGIGDRGPCYLHDGRAGSLDEAIVLHGGEAADSARAYQSLPLSERRAVQLFLSSLRRMPQGRISVTASALRAAIAAGAFLGGCGRSTWVAPAASSVAPALVEALESAFARSAAEREADYRELVSPGTRDRELAVLLGRSDLVSYARAGERLFFRDFRGAGSLDPLRRRSGDPRGGDARAAAAADATRCAGCHHRGGSGGAGSFADLAFFDAPDDDLLRARARLPPMLAGAALLELAARDDPSRHPFGRAPGRPRALREAVAACAATHLDARWDDARVDAVAAWLALLPTPIEETRMRDALVLRAARGRRLFDSIGCAGCHTPSLALATPVLPLAGARTLDLRARLSHDGRPPYRVWAYSDLRAHDLGPGLADPDGAAHFVTAPLWGLASRRPYLHDGRAATVPDAIEAHAGEAAASRQSFQALTGLDQADLRIFLGSLTRPVAVEAIP